MKPSFFERYPKLTLLGVSALFMAASLFFIEIAAKKLFGLGNVVIYQSHPVYGYRPLPHQRVARQANQVVSFNNLSLRAQNDWVENDFHHKVLFLGDSVTYGGSYINNEELFSHLALEKFPDYVSGNAGVNAWGVDNVHALVKEMAFLPAQIYVSVFPEGDFYRGLMRIGGQPFWTRPPNYALEELFQYIIFQIHLKKTPGVSYEAFDKNTRTKIVEPAVKHLKDLDIYLKQNDRQHLIFITPSMSQLQGRKDEDEIIKQLLEKYHLSVVYLKDYLGDLPDDQIKDLYHDEIHLSVKGHKKWAELIGNHLQDAILENESQSILVQKAYENKNT